MVLALSWRALAAEEFPKPYSPPCTERENIFVFTEKPTVKKVADDKYEIAFAVKGNCDVTVGLVDSDGIVVRHLGSGVLGANAPAPFQKNSLKQTLYWNGKDDLYVYHKTPEKLKVRVMLGLKPEFDKRIGGTSPYNLAGNEMGIAVAQDGVCVFSRSGNQTMLRKFDHDGKYIQSLVPPPTSLPEEKLKGWGYVEYEPGKRAVQGPDSWETISHYGCWLPQVGTFDSTRPAVVGNRIYYAKPCKKAERVFFLVHFVGTDGSTEEKGLAGQVSSASYLSVYCGHLFDYTRLAASPDGKWLYMVGKNWNGGFSPVLRGPVDGSSPSRPFIGTSSKGVASYLGVPGSTPGEFNMPSDVDCDAAGRIYVADSLNNRVQIFSPEGKYLKEIPLDRPTVLSINKKTGAIYAQHQARVQGKSVARLTKLASFDETKEEYHMDGISTP